MKRERIKLRILGKRIKELRKSKNLTQEDFSNQLSVSVDTVKNWEQGYCYPAIDTLVDIAKYFQCDFDYLMGQQDAPNKEYRHFSEETGLSEKAVESLMWPDRNGNTYGDIISALLENEELLSQIALCCNTDYTKINFAEMWAALLPSGGNRITVRPDYVRQSNEMTLYRALCDFIKNKRQKNGLDANHDI